LQSHAKEENQLRQDQSRKEDKSYPRSDELAKDDLKNYELKTKPD
jgi:hypothetical protein